MDVRSACVDIQPSPKTDVLVSLYLEFLHADLGCHFASVLLHCCMDHRKAKYTHYEVLYLRKFGICKLNYFSLTIYLAAK